jgi:2-oxoglutarate-Fe(II)-dependent oxygenase superfamily protein
VSAASPFLAPSGPFDIVADEQNGRNQLGRARLDSEGRLRASLRTRRIASAVEAIGCDFVCAEDVMSANDCGHVIAAFDALSQRVVKDDPVDPYWSGRYLWAADMVDAHPEAVRMMREATDRARSLVERFYALQAPLYNDIFQLVQWPAGLSMRPHADRANPDGSRHGMPYRHYAGILYLNDDYEGGELYFTALDLAIKPKRGMFVGFTGGFHHEHAVTRVESGAVRMTMPSFYSFDARHADRLIHPGVASSAQSR